jgi:hypothetical protein
VDRRSQATLLAVILVRVQVDSPDQRLDSMADLRLEQAFTSDEEMALLVSGMSNLAKHLLVKLQQATGATASEILDDIGAAAAHPDHRRGDPDQAASAAVVRASLVD